MTLPGQTITRADGGLGLSSDLTNKFLYVLTSSSGTANTIATYSSSTRLRSALGVGDEVEGACWRLDHGGAGSIAVLKVAGSVAASNSAVTHTGTGPTVTIAGTALITTTATILVTTGGALGVGKFAYTLDGETWVENLTIPAGGTYAIPSTGITATFPSGTYVLGDTYAFTTTPATYNLSDLTTAWTTAVAHDDEWPIVVFCGYSASATAAATIGAGIISLCAQLEVAFKYPRALMSCGNDTESNVLAQFASVKSTYLELEHGKIQMFVGTKIPGWSWPTLPYVYEKARRCSLVAPATNPAWAGLKDDVAISLIKTPSFDEFKDGASDLHDAQINTMRTYPRKRGVYPTNSLLASAAGSDYRYLQWGRVIDIYSTTVQAEQQAFINRSVRTVVSGTTEQVGCLDPRDAEILAKDVKKELDEQLLSKKTSEGLPGYCSAYSYAIDLTNKILSTRQLRSSGRIAPLANIEQVTTEIGMAMEIA